MPEELEAMRRDYEAGMTLRALALKYECSKSAVDKRAKKYGWTRGGSGQVDTMDTEPKHAGNAAIPDYRFFQSMAGRLLDRVGETLENPKLISARDLRSLAATLLDVRQLLNVVSPIEAEEQRLRIEGLRKQADAAATTAEVTVRFVDTEEAET